MKALFPFLLSPVLGLASFGLICSDAMAQPVEPKAAAQDPAPKKPVDKEAKPGEDKKDDTKKTDEKPAEPKPAEPKPEPPAPDSPAGKFVATQAKWTANDKRLLEITKEYSRAEEPQRAALKAEYLKLVGESEKLLPEVRATALAAFEAEPNKSADVTRTLIGLIKYDVSRDENEQALALAGKMVAAKCEEPLLYSFAGAAAFRSDDYETAEKYLTLADKSGKLDPEFRQYFEELPAQKKAWETEQAIRAKEAKADDLPRVKLETNKGTIVIELFENEAPGAVGNFISLVEKKFYDGLTFHRVLGTFMAQGGDPDGAGTGGPGYKIYCECDKPEARKHFRGTLSMAHSGKDTAGSQFFLTFRPTTHLNAEKAKLAMRDGHTVFGRVIEGFDVLPKLQRRDPTGFNPPPPDKIVKAEVIRKRDHAYEPNKVK